MSESKTDPPTYSRGGEFIIRNRETGKTCKMLIYNRVTGKGMLPDGNPHIMHAGPSTLVLEDGKTVLHWRSRGIYEDKETGDIFVSDDPKAP
ncbi:MAG: hypothetical protein ABSH22_23225 [Tepidisphaeraceae bacterium]